VVRALGSRKTIFICSRKKYSYRWWRIDDTFVCAHCMRMHWYYCTGNAILRQGRKGRGLLWLTITDHQRLSAYFMTSSV